MKRLLFLTFAFFLDSSNTFAQAPQTIKLDRGDIRDIPDGPGCSFYLAPPDGTGTEASTILWVQTSVDGDVFIRINGKNLRLKWAPRKKTYKPGADFSGTWSNGKVTLEIYCDLIDEPENNRFYRGFLEIRIQKRTYKYNIDGFCGC